MSHFFHYYRVAACEQASGVRRRWGLDMCLDSLDKLVVEHGRRWRSLPPGAMPRDAVSEVVRDELQLRSMKHDDAVPDSKVRYCNLFVVLLRFKFIHELNQYGIVRRKEKAAGVRSPRRPAFTHADIQRIVRSVRRQLREAT